MSQYFNLKGKIILVTGGYSGLGESFVKGLAAEGAHVVIHGRDQAKLALKKKEFLSQGLKVSTSCFDVTDRKSIKESIDLIEYKIGSIYGLINNAGIVKRTLLQDLDEDEWNEVINTDLTGPFMVSKYVGQYMIKRQEGKIINICSLMSEVGRDTVAAYAAAKGGLKMLTKSMATEWARYNIQINGIGPGFIATEINASYRTPSNPLNDFIINRSPSGRWGRPDDLIGTAIFLCSKASNFINGQIIYVDGGLLATVGKPVTH